MLLATELSLQLSTPFEGWKLLFNLEFTNSARLAGRQAPEILLPLPTQRWDCGCMILLPGSEVGANSSPQVCVTSTSLSKPLPPVTSLATAFSHSSPSYYPQSLPPTKQHLHILIYIYFFNPSLSSNLRCTLTPSNAAKSLNCPSSYPSPQPSLLRIKSRGAYAEFTTSPFPLVSSPGDQDPLSPQLESHVLPSPELTLTKAGHISHPQLRPPTLSSPGMAGGGGRYHSRARLPGSK